MVRTPHRRYSLWQEDAGYSPASHTKIKCKGRCINMLSNKQEKMVKILSEKMVSPKELAELMGKDYTEQKVRSMALTLYNKGLIDKTKVSLLLMNTPMVKFLGEGYAQKAQLTGAVPSGSRWGAK